MRTSYPVLPCMYVRFRCRVETHTDVNTVGPQYGKHIANYAVLSMGPRIRHFEGPIKDGVFEVEHKFVTLDGAGDNSYQSYYNQMNYPFQATDEMREAGLLYHEPGDDKLKSRMILWTYLAHQEDQAHPHGGAHEEEHQNGEASREDTSGHIVRRMYLLGSTVLNVLQVMEASIDVTEKRAEYNPAFAPNLDCCHNFTKETYSTFTLEPLQGNTDNVLKLMKDSVLEINNGLKKYEEEVERAKKDERAIDYDRFKIMKSALEDIPNINATVTAQQGLIQGYCGMAIKAGQMTLADPAIGGFMSCSTFGQLYGDAICFTDCSDVVKVRGAEIPFKLAMIYTYAGAKAHGKTPGEVARMLQNKNAHKLLFIFKSILSCEIMDSKQSE